MVCPGVRENITASPEQRIAVSCIEYGAESSIKSLLFGDSPMIGKTLSALMTLVRSHTSNKSPNLVVVHESLTYQWMTEIGKFFVPVSFESGCQTRSLTFGRVLSRFWQFMMRRQL